MANPKKAANNIIYRKNINIGSADAEMDDQYLDTCFVETEDISTLLDTSSPQRIIIGRTGAGKTALLKRIEKISPHVVFLSPEDFSFRYLADSSIIRFFEAAGVNLNIFYLLLWRHVICVELIKKRYNISTEDKMKWFLGSLSSKISGNIGKKKAFDYLEEWGNKFWETTEVRIKELAQKFESELASKLQIGPQIFNLGAEGAAKLTNEQKLEVLNIGKDVVSRLQIEKLTEVINLLNTEIFDDPKDRYYVLIDNLDENWAEEKLRYKIIRALIDTVKKFQRVQNVKVIISLREDLLQRVLRETRDSGFQEEKIEPLYLRLFWNEDELEKILNLRIQKLFKYQYNQDRVTVSQILPTGQRDQKSALSYILTRTFLRPREAIIFMNFCLECAAGKTAITFKIIKDAEMFYSRKRLRSLCDEWIVDYPLLEVYISLLHGFPSQFLFKNLHSLKSLDDILLDAACREEKCNNDTICMLSKPYLEAGGKGNSIHILKEIVCAFYQVGILGVKLAENYPIEWSYRSEPVILPEQLEDGTRLYIHPTFHCALSINDNRISVLI